MRTPSEFQPAAATTPAHASTEPTRNASLSSFPMPSPMLVVEGATSAGSTALVIDGRVVGRQLVAMGVTRDDTLFPAVQALLADAAIEARELRAIVCGAGPGSFTSLRIAASLAKGLAFANGCALYSVSSLMLAAATVRRAGKYLVHADALRGERFALDVAVDDHGIVRAESAVRRVAFADLAALSHDRARLALLSSPDGSAEFQIVTPDAAAIISCADWLAEGAVSIDQWEPDYGRLAEAQVKWEETHGRALADG